MTLRISGIFLCLIAIMLAPFPALAGEPRLIKTDGQWNSYVVLEGGKAAACYMASKPVSSKGKYAKRGAAYAIITHRPPDRTKNVFNYQAGYTYKPGSDVTVEIDGVKFMLYTSADTAWAQDSDTDNKLAKAISSGKSMTVRGMSSKGTETTDTISLDGSGAAYERITGECY